MKVKKIRSMAWHVTYMNGRKRLVNLIDRKSQDAQTWPAIEVLAAKLVSQDERKKRCKFKPS